MGLSDGFYETLGNCLLCMACVERCTNGVRTDALVTAGRAAFVQARGLDAAKRLVHKALLAGPTARRAAAGVQRPALQATAPSAAACAPAFPCRSWTPTRWSPG